MEFQDTQFSSNNELKVIFDLIQNWFWWLLFAILFGSGIGFLYSSSQTPTFSARASVFISQPTYAEVQTSSQQQANERLTLSYTKMMVQRPVLQDVIDELDLDLSTSFLKKSINVSLIEETQILEIVVLDSDPERAAAIANTLGDVFVRYNDEFQTSRFKETKESLTTQIAAAEVQIENTLQELDEVGISSEVNSARELLQVKLLAYQESYNTILQEFILASAYSEPEVAVEEDGEVDIYLQLDQIQQRLTEFDDRINQFSPIERQGVEYDLLVSKRNSYQVVYDQLIKQLTGEDAPVGDAETPVFTGASLSSLSLQLEILEQNLQNTALELEQLGGDFGNAGKVDRLEANLALYRQTYSNLLQSFEEVRLSEIQSSPTVILVEPAIPPQLPISPNVYRDAFLGGILALMGAAGIIYLIETLDDRIKRPDDIITNLELPILGVIAKHQTKDGYPISESEPRSPVAEAFRSLRTSIRYASVDHPVRTLVITSPEASAGKSTIATNLSIVLAQGGHKTVIIDADMRRPRVHQFLNLDKQIGLSSLFVHDNQNGELITNPEKTLKPTKVNDLYAITSGESPPNPSELLGSDKMSTILDSIREDADMIVVDAPPIMAVTDAAVLATHVDGVLLVVQPGQTRMGSAQQTVEQLRRVGTNIIGVVLNNVIQDKRSYGGYYYRYDDSYYADDSRSRSQNRMFSRRRIIFGGLGLATIILLGWFAFVQGLFPGIEGDDILTEVPKTEAVSLFVDATATPIPTEIVVFVEGADTPTPQNPPTSTQTPTETLTPTITDTIPPPTPGPELMTPFGPDNKFVLHQVVEGESLPIIAQAYELDF
jgi:polysaccharide biosynthesis transport protein